MTRRLVREEGIFCGGSSGAAVAGALHYIQEHNLGPNTTLVVVLPDSGDRYLSKVFNDDWMRENSYMVSTWAELKVSNLLQSKKIRELYTARPDDLQAKVIAMMKEHDISQVPVVDEGRFVGIVTEVELLDHLLTADHTHAPDETIESLVRTQVATVSSDTPLETLMSILTTHRVVIVLEREVAVGIITKIDLLDFMASQVK